MASARSVNTYEGIPTVDADTTDYWDENGVPPPHRLSSHLGHSPYLGGSSPRGSYHDPFSNSATAQPITASFDLDRPRDSLSSFPAGTSSYPPGSRSSIDMAAHLPPSRAFAAAGAPGSPSYGRVDSNDDLAGSAAAPLWGRSEMTPTAQRERYLARREQQDHAENGGGGYTYGNEKNAAGASRRKWWIIGAVVLALIIIVGVVAGVLVAKNKDKSSAGGSLGVVSSDKNDPSKFEKDPKLKRSFYGLCMTPAASQFPQCGATLDSVIEDIQLVSQLTTRIRTYGADCNVPSLVLEAISKTKVDMTVWLAVWVPQPADDPDGATYDRQVAAVVKAIQTWGVDHVGGVTVGNEFLLNNGPESELITKMAAMRTTLAGLNLPKVIPVGTADAGSMVTTTLGAGSDYVMANVHAWFGGVPIGQAAGWTWNYMANQEPSSATLAANKPQMYIAEVGWPTGANETRLETLGPAVAGIPQLNEFLASYVCTANANITAGDPFSQYFFFEAFDELWKDALYGGVEAHWGIMGADRKLKDGLVLPDCASP